MGFLSGAFSGLTLTSTTLYLTLLAHQRHRAHQATLLRQQALLLNSLLDPAIVPLEDAPRFTEYRPSVTEAWKERWNGEVEGAVRWAQGVRWGDVRQGVEGAWSAWRGGKEGSE